MSEANENLNASRQFWLIFNNKFNKLIKANSDNKIIILVYNSTSKNMLKIIKGNIVQDWLHIIKSYTNSNTLPFIVYQKFILGKH
jgi:hypothetical protein